MDIRRIVTSMFAFAFLAIPSAVLGEEMANTPLSVNLSPTSETMQVQPGPVSGPIATFQPTPHSVNPPLLGETITTAKPTDPCPINTARAFDGGMCAPIMTTQQSPEPPQFCGPDGCAGSDPGMPSLSRQERRDFTNEMRNVQNDAQRLLKDMGKSKNTDELRKRISDIIAGAVSCLGKIGKGTDQDEREAIDDCRNERYWDEVNDIRNSFVPAQELKNELGQMNNQLRDLTRFRKELVKTGATALVDKLIAEIQDYQKKVKELSGQDQRDVLQDYRDARYWDEMNGIRAMAEIPKNLSSAVKDLKSAEKYLTQKSLAKALSFFGLDMASIQVAIGDKRTALNQISAALASGDPETAQDLMEEHVYRSWHPGNLRHTLDMYRESYDSIRFLKNQSEIKEQIMDILEPINEAFASGEYQEVEQAMQQFTNELRPYRQYFERSGKTGFNLDAKTRKLLNKLEMTIEQKLGSDE